jgi:anthranilate/para-aminobenzoate synthase component II
MAMSHRTRPIFGIQFHPESFGTIGGDALIRNFLEMTGEVAR